jgi:hypothetical protein
MSNPLQSIRAETVAQQAAVALANELPSGFGFLLLVYPLVGDGAVDGFAMASHPEDITDSAIAAYQEGRRSNPAAN